MDFFNKAFGQLSDLFRSMTVGARITAGLLLAVVVMSVVWLFRYQASSPDHYLMNGIPLSSNDIMNMEAAFGEKGLKDSVVEGGRIRVPRGQKDLYMAAAAEMKALPRGFGGYLDDAINQGGIWDAPGQSKERLKNATQKELARIIGQMSGIEAASVLLDSESKQGLLRETIKTALVSVKPRGSASLDDSQVESIRHLITGAVADLKYGSVKVVDENSGRTYYGDPESGTGSMDNVYYATKRRVEKQWTEKILSQLLPYVPGVTVAVNVELEKEMGRREIEQKPDQKTVPVRKRENTRSRTREGSVPGGRAGFQVNQPQALALSGGKGSHEEEEQTETIEDSFIGTTSTQRDIPGLTTNFVKASIGVPTSYFERVWRERNPTQPGEQPKTPTATDLEQISTQEIAKIKSAVVGLLPPPKETTDLTQLVTVTPFQEIVPEPTPVPGLPLRTLDWLVENWSMLGLIFLGGFSLVVLRSVARSAPASSPRPLSLSLPADLAAPVERTPEPQEAVTPTERRLRRVTAGGPSLRDELSEIVAEDPDAAASILRTWIGGAR